MCHGWGTNDCFDYKCNIIQPGVADFRSQGNLGSRCQKFTVIGLATLPWKGFSHKSEYSTLVEPRGVLDNR